jgi:hypothetical protein
MNDATCSSRSFLYTFGGLSVASLVPPDPRVKRVELSKLSGETRGTQGLAMAPDDFRFAKGLIYLQTALALILNILFIIFFRPIQKFAFRVKDDF